jgi:hypothetical protein
MEKRHVPSTAFFGKSKIDNLPDCAPQPKGRIHTCHPQGKAGGSAELIDIGKRQDGEGHKQEQQCDMDGIEYPLIPQRDILELPAPVE